MKKDGVLILSHCGYSFVDQIVPLVRDENLSAYVLSSHPDFGHEHRVQALKDLADWASIIDTHELEWHDIESAIDSLQQQGIKINACITVWEGYRPLMAMANQALGIRDLLPGKVEELTDKLFLRQQLCANGLSKAIAEPLSRQLLMQYQHENAQKFIKPRKGIASFGTFRLTKNTNWEDIKLIEKECQMDTVYRSIFDKEDNFIIEDLINGIEASFEILVVDGLVYTIAVHEKVETSSKEMTTLENACVCPPINISENAVQQGIAWLKEVFSNLQINYGCFHVEAKYNECWELIEINPRVGGSLISSCVEHFTGGDSMLKLWLQTLLITSANSEMLIEHLKRLDIADQGTSPSNRSTFFRVYFGEAGIVADVKQAAITPAPLICQILIKPGTKFISETKENFVGQALWGDSLEHMTRNYKPLLTNSRDLLNITYTLANQGAA